MSFTDPSGLKPHDPPSCGGVGAIGCGGGGQSGGPCVFCVNGIGGQVGGEAALGFGYGAGFASTVSAGAGAFWGGNQGVNFGSFTTDGTAGYWGSNVYETYYDPLPPMVVGGGANLGPSVFVTNATSQSDLIGPFYSTGFAVAFEGGVAFNISIGQDSAGNTIWQGSAGLIGGYAAYEYSIPTMTHPLFPR